MLESLSKHIAGAIKKADPDGPASIEVMTYALSLKLNFYFTLFFIVILGLFTGKILESLLSLLVVMISRKLTGGRHFSSLTHCMMFTATLCIIAPLIKLTPELMILMNLICLAIFLVYGPNHTLTEISSEKRLDYKIAICLCVLLNLILPSPFITIILLIQSLSILSGGEHAWRRS